MRWRTVARCIAPAALALMVGGCAALYLVGGKGQQKALYKFSKTDKVLVLVEVREGVAAPPYLTSAIADSVDKHLWKFRAVEAPMISQDKLAALQTAHPEEFKKMGVADIALATGADAVVQLYITQFMTPTTTDGSVGEGYAEAYVKVIDKKGTRLYPGETTGLRLVGHDDEMLVSDRDRAKTVQDLLNQLSLQTGRLFHAYDLDDKDLNPSNLDSAKQLGHIGE